MTEIDRKMTTETHSFVPDSNCMQLYEFMKTKVK